MTETRETQVLVIGVSLIGLTSSLLLSSLGIEHVLVDRRPHTSDHPRARLYDRRTMELLRRFGVHREVEATGIGDLWTRQNRWIHSLTGPQIAEVPTESFQMAPVDYSPSMPVMGAQDLIEEALWKAARDYIVEAVGVNASELDLEIQSIRPWRFIAGLSKHFSNARIFLAGDAAHAFIPTGGMGSNA